MQSSSATALQEPASQPLEGEPLGLPRDVVCGGLCEGHQQAIEAPGEVVCGVADLLEVESNTRPEIISVARMVS